MTSPKLNTILFSLAGVLILLGLVVFAASSSPGLGLYARSESPEFCGSCHVLQMEYEAWFHSGAHHQIKCIDCHLPNNNLANHLLWKGLDGLKDTVKFHTGMVSEPIRISERGAQMVEANCRRCHAETVALIKEDRRCWDCHRSLSHKRTGAIATLTP